MSKQELENLAGIGKLKAEPGTRAEFDGLVDSARKLQRDNYDGRLPTIKLAKSGSRRVARRELPV